MVNQKVMTEIVPTRIKGKHFLGLFQEMNIYI